MNNCGHTFVYKILIFLGAGHQGQQLTTSFPVQFEITWLIWQYYVVEMT